MKRQGGGAQQDGQQDGGPAKRFASAKLEDDRVARTAGGSNIIEDGCGKTCSHEVAWPPGEQGAAQPPPRRAGPPAREYDFPLDPFQQTAVNCLEAGEQGGGPVPPALAAGRGGGRMRPCLPLRLQQQQQQHSRVVDAGHSTHAACTAACARAAMRTMPAAPAAAPDAERPCACTSQARHTARAHACPLCAPPRRPLRARGCPHVCRQDGGGGVRVRHGPAVSRQQQRAGQGACLRRHVHPLPRAQCGPACRASLPLNAPLQR